MKDEFLHLRVTKFEKMTYKKMQLKKRFKTLASFIMEVIRSNYKNVNKQEF